MASEKRSTGEAEPISEAASSVESSHEPLSEGEQSVVDLAQQPLVSTWVQFVGALLAIVGVGIGVLVLLVANVFEASLWEVEGFGGIQLSLPPDQLPYLAVFVAGFFGAYLARTLSADDRTTSIAAALSIAVGTIAVLVTSTLLTSVAIDNVSINFGDLLLITLSSAFVTGAVAAGGVWLVRNRWPDDGAVAPN